MNKHLLLCLALVASAPIYAADFSADADHAQGKVLCKVCNEPQDISGCINLSCGHTYCRECLHQMIQYAEKDKNLAAIKCPNPDCERDLEANDIEKIAGKDVAHNISDMETDALLKTMPGIRQCPTPDCTYRFFNESNLEEKTMCPQCHECYCANCLAPHAAQITCQEHAADQRATLDYKSAEWLKENTKPCPACKARVQKIDDGRCLLVHCSNKNCPEFCWKCNREHDHVWNCNDKPLEVEDNIDDILIKQKEEDDQSTEEQIMDNDEAASNLSNPAAQGELMFDRNMIREVPRNLNMPALERLVIDRNMIRELPANFNLPMLTGLLEEQHE